MDNCKAMNTPMGSSTYVDQDESGTPIDITKYRGMIGSLLYLTASRPGITFSVCLCARFQANPKESHLMAVKRIMKYLKGSTNVGLWYPKGSIFTLIVILTRIMQVVKLIVKAQVVLVTLLEMH